MATETLYKVLKADATATHAHGFKWDTRGKWMPPIKGALVA